MKKFVAISLALLVLASSIGFSMNTHLCGGVAVETTFSLGLHDLDCGMNKGDKVCESIPSDEDQVMSRSCCENKHQVIQLDENAEVQSFSIGLNYISLIPFVCAFFQSTNDQTQAVAKEYSPPRSNRNIQVLFQSFLI